MRKPQNRIPSKDYIDLSDILKEYKKMVKSDPSNHLGYLGH
jgi:hypothetical protein|tara:strand:- start:5013 stop:5135 length:123 start_codon:yes stop_codon:yes gene_type:complete